jgi:tetratricopeptide (TPR) repeat protein
MRAEQEAMRAETERLRAERERARAESESQKLAAAETYVQDVLGSVDPTRHGNAVEVSKLLDEYEETIEKRFAGQPLAEARVRSSLAWNHLFLTLMENTGPAEEHWDAAMGHLRRALEIRSRELGEEHPETIESFEMLAQFLAYGRDPERAEQLRRQVLDIRMRTLGADAAETLDARSELASILGKRGKLEEAERLRREVYEANRRLHGDEAGATLAALGTLARIRQQSGALAEAEEMCRQRLETARRLFRPGSDSLDSAVSALANVYVAQGKLEQARDLYGIAIEPGEPGIEEWLNGETEITFAAPTLLVYWEPWCPFSQAYVPNVNRLCSTYDDGALRVIGLVGLTKNSTREQAMWFIERNHLGFPNAKFDRQPFDRIHNTSIPAAMALVDGEIVWVGHPETISRSFLDGLVAGAARGGA